MNKTTWDKCRMAFDDMCDMVEEATRVRDDAFADLDAEEQKAIDSIDYWGGEVVQTAVAKTIKTLNDRRKAVLDEFDRIEELAARIEDYITGILIDIDND